MEIHRRIGHARRAGHLAGMNAAPMLIAIQAKTGWKQQQLAEKLQVAQSSISRALKGAKVTYDLGLSIKRLAEEVGVLTNETGTSKLSYVVPVRGRARMAEDLEWSTDLAVTRVATLPFPVPSDCFGVEIGANGVTLRARKGDLVVAGPETDDLTALVNQEAVLILENGTYVYGTLVYAGQSQFSIIGPHGILHEGVSVTSGGAYWATIAAGRWSDG